MSLCDCHYLLHTLVNKVAATDELVAELYVMSTGVNFDAFVARQRLPPSRSIHSELKNLNVPTLLLWGKNDSVQVSRALSMLDLIPGGELYVFDRCSHWAQLDQASRINSVVRDFLLQPSRRAGG